MRHPDRSNPAPSNRRSLRRKAAFGAVATIGLLAILEVAGRTIPPAANARWAYESSHVRTTGFPALNEVLEPDPTRFWRLRAGVPTTRIIGRVGADDLIFNLSTDEHGWRRTPEVASARETICFLGDSCTLGIGVDDGQSIPAVVQRLRPGTRCLNLGVPGYSAYQGRATLEQLPAGVKPSIVVINFGFNDDATWDGRGDMEHASAPPMQPRWFEQLGAVRLIDAMLPARATPPPASSGRPRLTDEEFAEQLRKIIAICHQRGTRPVLLAWPLRVQMREPNSTSKQRAIGRVGEATGTQVIDLVAGLSAMKVEPAAEFADLLHLSETGCEHAAKLIVQGLNGAASSD